MTPIGSTRSNIRRAVDTVMSRDRCTSSPECERRAAALACSAGPRVNASVSAGAALAREGQTCDDWPMSEHLPRVYVAFRESFPEIAQQLDALAVATESAGPLDA